jgi:hypothetical protein
MPHPSNWADMLYGLDKAALALARVTYDHIVQDDIMDSLSSPSSASDPDDFMNIMAITPHSPLSPFLSDYSESDFNSSGDEVNNNMAHYNCLQDQIAALWDEVEKACVLHHPDEPMP